eukprot:jgi/Mesvir1/23180/Mv22649-RA.1
MDDNKASFLAVAQFNNVFGQALDGRTSQALGKYIYGIVRGDCALVFTLSDLEGGVWKACKDVPELEHMKAQTFFGGTLAAFLPEFLWAPLVVRAATEHEASVEWHVSLGRRTKVLTMALARVSDASTSALEHKSLVLSAFDAFYANCNPLGAERGVGGYAVPPV